MKIHMKINMFYFALQSWLNIRRLTMDLNLFFIMATRQQTISRLVCVAPPGGVDWELWTQMDNVWLENLCDCTVSYRVRKQWGKKMVTVFGPADSITWALNKSIEVLAARAWGWRRMQWLPAPPMGWELQWMAMPLMAPTVAAASPQTFPVPEVIEIIEEADVEEFTNPWDELETNPLLSLIHI